MFTARRMLPVAAFVAATLLSITAHALSTPQLLRLDTGRADQGHAVANDAVGNVYVAASLSGDSQRSDFAIIKYDARGSRSWTARYSGSGSGQLGRALAVTADSSGNVYATGSVMTVAGGVARGIDLVVVRFSPDGIEQWSRRVPAGAGSRVALDASGNVYVGGIAGSTDVDFVIEKYSSNGVLLWDRRFDGTLGTNDRLSDLEVGPDGNVVVTGWTDSSTGQRGATDVATIKFDAQGDTLWQNVFSENAAADEKPWDLAIDSAGNVYVTGETTADTSGELPVFPLTLKYGSDGRLQFTRIGEGFGGRAIAVAATGGIVVAGGAVVPHVARLDAAGNPLWISRVPALPGVSHVAVNAAGEVFAAAGGQFHTLHFDAAGTVIGQHALDSQNRNVASGISLSSVGDLYVTGTAFTSTISSSADVLTLRFAQGGVPIPLPDVLQAPTNLRATVDSQRVSLQWTDNASAERGYAIERCTGRSCTAFVEIARVAANARSFSDGGLARNTEYRYRVRAFSDTGNSGYSNVASVRTPRR
jgi:hypothetical protein